MLCTVYAEQCTTAVLKIYVTYSVQRVVHDSCIQEYMLCTLYSRFIEKSEGQLYSTIYVMCTVQCMKNSEGQQYSRIDLCTEYGEQYRTAVFKNICCVQCMESSARRQLYSRIYGMYIVQSVYVEWRRTAVFKNICYVQCMKSSARQLYSRIYLWREMNLQGTSLCWGIPTRRIFT